jgi:hypothetical protein
VKKFIASSNSKSGQQVQDPSGTAGEDFWERTDIWAEAVKSKLIKMKEIVAKEMSFADKRKVHNVSQLLMLRKCCNKFCQQELELTGARSKDIIQQFPPVTWPPISEDPRKEQKGIVEAPPGPPPSSGKNDGRSGSLDIEDHSKKKINKSHEGKKSHELKVKKSHELKGKKSREGKKSNEERKNSDAKDPQEDDRKKSHEEKKGHKKSKEIHKVESPRPIISATMRKRGETPMPTSEQISNEYFST